MSKHVFPLILDGAVQGTTSAEDWNGSTSYVTADATGGAYEIGLGAAKHAGTIVTFIKTDAVSNDVTVNPDTDFDSSVASIVLGGQNESCTFIWTGESWRMFTQDQTNSTAFTGGSVSSLTVTGATVLQGNVDVGSAADDTIGFFGATKVAQPADAAQAAVSAEGDLPTEGTGASSTYTQAEITAAIENIHDLIALTNELRSSLVDLGLIKGAA